MLNAVTSGRIAVTEPAGERHEVGVSNAAPYQPRFTSRDRGIIRDYFKIPRPALINRERLARGVGTGAVLAPTINGRGLPSELEVQLSRSPVGYERRIVGHDIVWYERNQRLIADIVYDALP